MLPFPQNEWLELGKAKGTRTACGVLGKQERLYLASLRLMALVWLTLNFKIQLLSIKNHDKSRMPSEMEAVY